MAHVQGAGYVGRRYDYAVGLAFGVGLGPETALTDPMGIPPVLGLGRVEMFGYL